MAGLGSGLWLSIIVADSWIVVGGVLGRELSGGKQSVSDWAAMEESWLVHCTLGKSGNVLQLGILVAPAGLSW
jgi:hypothetical protein